MLGTRFDCVCRTALILAIATALPAVPAANAAADDVSVQGEIVAVDLSSIAFDGPAVVHIRTVSEEVQSIAVPSMGRNLCAARDRLAAPEAMNVGDLVSVRGTRSGDGAIVPCEGASHALRLMSLHSSPDLGFRLAYPKEPAGYVAAPVDTGDHPDFLYGLSLTARADLEAGGGQESPKAITVRVYRNGQHFHAPVWVDRNPDISSIDLATGLEEEAVLAGANAVRYRTDGLYRNEHVAAAHDSRIFLLTVAFDSPGDDIYADFLDLLDSFEFIPPE